MPRIASNTAAALADLTKRLERLVVAARREGRYWRRFDLVQD